MVPGTNQIAAGLKCCPECSAQMPHSAGFCPGCGHSMVNESGGVQKHSIGRDRLLGACAYFTFLPAVAFLLFEPYRRNSFVRFHAVQCLLFWLVSVVAAVLVRVLISLLVFVPSLGPLLAVLCVTIPALAALFLWIVLVAKAIQGERFTLPVIGSVAENYSRSS